jgi:tubulin monoglycylase TTLL15
MEKFNEYVNANPNSVFVEKNYGNRGVKIVKLNEIKFDESEKIYQKFIDNPFLIDGHAFDLGIYVLITSINPLRVYRYDQEIFVRFCPEEFYPFELNDTDKYVVAGNHLPAHELESFEELYEDYGYSLKKIFEYTIKNKGFDVEKLWSKIEDAIVSIVLQNEQKFIREVKFLRVLFEFAFSNLIFLTHFSRLKKILNSLTIFSNSSDVISFLMMILILTLLRLI